MRNPVLGDAGQDGRFKERAAEARAFAAQRHGCALGHRVRDMSLDLVDRLWEWKNLGGLN